MPQGTKEQRNSARLWRAFLRWGRRSMQQSTDRLSNSRHILGRHGERRKRPFSYSLNRHQSSLRASACKGIASTQAWTWKAILFRVDLHVERCGVDTCSRAWFSGSAARLAVEVCGPADFSSWPYPFLKWFCRGIGGAEPRDISTRFPYTLCLVSYLCCLCIFLAVVKLH